MVFLSYLWSEAKFSDMDKVQKQRGSIVLHKETRDGADYIRIEYANSQAVALLLAQDTGMEMAGNGSAYIASAAFKLPDFYDRYSPHAYIDYSRVYVRHPKPKREYTLPKGYLELLEQKRYSLSTIKAYKIYFSDFMEYHKGQDLDLLTVEDINSYMLHMVKEKHISATQQNMRINAIKFYYEKVRKGKRQYYGGIARAKEYIWVPGTDHAGIATQNVVERALAKEGKRRQDLGREKFIERVWAWREEYGNRILNQIDAMGCSVDWTRLRFTMDEGLSRAVRKVFVQLYRDGLIYRGKYIINWCSRCHTALADDEVEHTDVKGSLWKIRYHLADSDQSVVIATTRPETIPGDTAICVHPDDERYRDLVGKTAIVPICGRHIPIIADRYVDREFGTGALKVTPCHDHNDWALGKNHNLEFIQVIDEDGIMKPEAGKYAGHIILR